MSIGIGFSGGGSGLTNSQKNQVAALANNFRGVAKPGGSNISVFEGYGAPATIMKLEAEAPFSRVRIWVFHRGAYGQGGWKFAVASTDKYAVDTVTNAFYPQKGGTVNNAAQTTSDEVGWNVVTWGNAAYEFGGHVTSLAIYRSRITSGKLYSSYDYDQSWQQSGVNNAIADAICSDWMSCKSITPSPVQPSGVARPFLLLKTYREAGAFPIEGTSAYNVPAATAQANYDAWVAATNPASRLRYLRTYAGGDGIADFTKVPAAAGAPNGTVDEHRAYIAVEYEYDVPTRSFALIGDSNIEGSAGSGFSSAIKTMSTLSKPMEVASFGASSNRSVQFLSIFDQAVFKGMRFTDWVLGDFSHNDYPDAYLEIDRVKNQILRILNEADNLGVTVWLYTHWDSEHGAGNAIMRGLNNWTRSICAQGRAKLVDVAANWQDSYSSDGGVHANATGISYCKDVMTAALSKNL